MTARWVVEAVAPHRDVTVEWQPISLLIKNDLTPDSESYKPSRFTHNLLRVMESVRTEHGNDGVFSYYWEVGSRIHHDGDIDFDPADALAVAGLDVAHAAAFDDEHWDDPIRTRMQRGLDLAGDDIGTPIIGFDKAVGEPVGIFGPVITRIPPPDLALQLWDGMVQVVTVSGFWELKRTRTERPDKGPRPAAHPFGN